MKKYAIVLFAIVGFLACESNQKKNQQNINEMSKATLTEEAKTVREYMKNDLVIAHRGSTYWTPEETEPAFLWARNIGADYLEFDVQLTKDSVLVAFHDSKLTRTTNITTVYPERADLEINDFTLKELRNLDVGSWFNAKNPERAKRAYQGLTILTLKDVVMIAEGYRIKRLEGKPVKEMNNGSGTGNYQYEVDPNDNGNRPGIYIETKSPKPGTEKVLAKNITDYGWNINSNPKVIRTNKGKIGVANTKARLVLQSFSPQSIIKIESYLPNIPKCFLLWQPEMIDDLKANYIKAIDFSIAYNVHGIGPSITGEPNNYEELTAPWMVKLMRNAGLTIHPYTFDTNKQLLKYAKEVDGVFTNRADLALEFYSRKSKRSSEEILHDLGYN